MTKEITVKPSRGEVTQEKLQEKLMLFQLMERHLEALKQQEALAEARMMELESTRNALEEVGKLKDDNETLIPLGSGFYARGRVTGKDILTELGASVMTEKSVRDALAFLELKSGELRKVMEQIAGQAGDIVDKLNRLGPELQRMAEQVQQ